jgi:acetoin utilization deacetylase AcuC-like enzyme
MRVYTDARCLGHPSPPGFPERPERVALVVAELERDGRFEIVRGAEPPELEAAIEAVHTGAYVERFRQAVARGDGLFDSADNPIGAGSFEAARAAAAATVAALDEVVGGRSPRAFAAVRPPGHHAERERAMGFCFFNNAAVAAQRAIARHGLARVAIVDFDVHHGNGTQHLFEERADVFYASLHQWPFYPGTGAAEECGRGAGAGTTLNLPLPAGAGDDDYRRAFDERLLPALGDFAPELLIVSAGFDAWRADPLGGMRVTDAGFSLWGERLRGVAERAGAGRALSLLEGGYDLEALPRLVCSYASYML